MLSLAAAVWEIPPVDALTRLSYEGIDVPPKLLAPEPAESFSLRVRRQAKLAQFWEHCRHHLVFEQSDRIRYLRQKLMLVGNIGSQERQLAGPATFFGSCSANRAYRAFRNATKTQPRSKHKHELFPGKGWDDVLVIPYFAAPGLISGLLFIGREARPADRKFYLAQRSEIDSGIAGLPAALEYPTTYTVAVQDPLLMCGMQARNFSSSLRPLPIVAWRAGENGTSGSWSALNGRRLIFWDMKLSPETLLHCWHFDADLIVAGPERISRERVGHFLRAQAITDLVRRLQVKAKPWREAMRSWLRRAAESETLTLFRRLQEIDPELLKAVQACLPSTSPLRQRPRLHVREAVVRGDMPIVERNDRWFTSKGSLLLDGVVRIERVILHRQAPTEYEGYLLTRKTRVPFLVDEKEKFSTRVAQLALEQCQQQIAKSKGAKFLKEIALAFHEPQIEWGHEQLGWDGKGFQMRHYRIANGKLSECDPKLMARSIQAPDTHTPRFGRKMAEKLAQTGPEAEFAWGVAVCAAEAAVAWPTGRPGPKVVLGVDGSFNAMAALLRRLGLPETILRHAAEAPRKFQLKWPHQWPVFVKMSRIGTLQRWLLETDHQGVFAITTAAGAPIVRWAGGDIISVYRPPGLDLGRLASMPVEMILPDYLRWLSRRDWEIPEKETPWHSVHASMMAWLRSRKVPVKALKASTRHLRAGNPDAPLEAVEALGLRQIHQEALIQMSHQRGWLPPVLDGLPDPLVVRE